MPDKSRNELQLLDYTTSNLQSLSCCKAKLQVNKVMWIVFLAELLMCKACTFFNKSIEMLMFNYTNTMILKICLSNDNSF